MKIPLLDLRAQYVNMRDEILAAVTAVLDSQVCIGGPKVAELEQKVASLCDCKYAVGVSSGTDALLCGLMALGIGSGDEVVTTPYTFFATVGSIVRSGATPVFVDIDPRTYNIDPNLIEKAITPRTKAVVPVHLFGQMCDMDPIIEIAERYGLYVIEDAAQSITSTYKGRKAGSIGTAGCFSFFPSKNLGGVGDGGMVVTNDQTLHDRLMMMRNHGARRKYHHKFVGGNFRLDPIQAAVLLVKLPRLDAWSEARRGNAAYYSARLEGFVDTPFIKPECVSIYNQYVIRTVIRDKLIEHLKQQEIGCEIYYPVSMHEQECFASLGYAPLDFPNSYRASRESVALPVYPELTRAMQDEVVSSVLSVCAPEYAASVLRG